MRVALLLMLLGAGRWDGNFTVQGTASSTNPTAVLYTTGLQESTYVKVTCDNDAYIGNTKSTGGTVCTATTCDWIKFSLGEKYYSQFTGSQNALSILCKTGTCACTVSTSSN